MTTMDFEQFKKQWEAKWIEVYVQRVTSAHDERMVGHEYWFRKIQQEGIHTTIFFNGSFGWSREDAEREAMLCVKNPYYMNKIKKYINE